MSPNTVFIVRIALFFSAVSALLCGVTYRILKKRLHLSPRASKALASLLCCIFILIVGGPIHYRTMQPDPAASFSNYLQVTQYFLMGWIGVVFLVFAAMEITLNLFKKFDPKKRIFLTEGVAKGVLAGVTFSSGVGFFQAKFGPVLNPVRLKVASLPESFEGLKIAQISDIHIGPVLHSEYLESVVEKVMSFQPDLIFITGDLVDGSVEQLSKHVEPLKKLSAREGVYFCTGNHEYYSGADEWIAHLETMGIHVFKNSNLALTRKNSKSLEEKILIAGVYDFQAYKMHSTHRTNPFLAAQTSEFVSTKILLAHNPYSIDDAAKAGFDLQISGHTHAGQFYPFAWITKLVFKHVEGLYVINEKTQLYVNRGTGFWGPPNRFANPSEITAFTLTRG